MSAALIPAAISVATSVAGGAGIATALAYGGINAVLSLALSSRRQPTAYQPSANPVGRKHILRSHEAPREIVYGRVRKSGLLTFAYSTGREGNLHLVLTFAAHKCDAIEKLWLDTEPSTQEKYRSHVQFTAHLGDETQQTDSDLAAVAPAWNETHRGQNITYAHINLRWDENLWNLGLPNISATVRGKHLYDPRIAEALEGESSIHPITDKAAYKFSDNPALCVLDYLISSFGLECDAHEIDWQSFAEAANLCDQSVHGDKRYRCNGVVTLEQSPIEVVEQLLTSCGGVLVYTQGQYRIFPAAPQTPSTHLDASYLRDDPKGLPKLERNLLFNSVRANFFDQQQQWLKTDLQPITNNQYIQDDGGKKLFYDLNLNFTTSTQEAQRLARQALEIVRPGARIQFPATLKALGIEVWDVVTVTLPQIGYINKPCRVLAWKINEHLGIDLELQEYDQSAYNDYQLTEARIPNTANLLPSPFFENIDFQLTFKIQTLLDAENINNEGAIPSRLVASWVLPSRLIRNISLQWKESAEQEWSGVNLPLETTQYDITQARVGRKYDCRVRMVNSLGFASPWQTLRGYSYTRQFQAPAVPRQFQIIKHNGSLKASWEIDSSLYLLGHLELRYKIGVDDAPWTDMQKVHNQPLRQRYSFVFPAPATGRLLFALRAYNRENIPSTLTARTLIVVASAAQNALPRDEATREWQGDSSNSGFVSELNHYHSRSQGGWKNLPSVWSQLPDTWKNILPASNSLVYTTEVINLGAVKDIQPIFQISVQGQFSITWRKGKILPLEEMFQSIPESSVSTQFVQFRILVDAEQNIAPTLSEFIIDEQR